MMHSQPSIKTFIIVFQFSNTTGCPLPKKEKKQSFREVLNEEKYFAAFSFLWPAYNA